MKLFASLTVKFCSLHSQSEVKFATNYFSLAPQVAQTSLPIGNFTFRRKLHSPKANLVVESACETHDTFDVAGAREQVEGINNIGIVT